MEQITVLEAKLRSLPYNPISGIVYQGRNVSELGTGEWATFIQWKSAGYKVKKGEHGKHIVKFIEMVEKTKQVRWKK